MTVNVPPTWLDSAKWVMEAYYLPEQIVCSAWMTKRYAWFTDGKEAEDRNGGVHIGGGDLFSMMMMMLIQMLIRIYLRVGGEKENISIT